MPRLHSSRRHSAEPISLPVSLDVTNARLRRGTEFVAIRPKDLAVLRELLAHQGRLVEKEALMSAGWPDVAVTEGVLKACINRLRTAFVDHPSAPRFIQTVHRRGYRFIGDLVMSDHAVAAPASSAEAAHRGVRSIVGRGAEVAQLDRAFGEAASGVRTVIFVSGEAGIGKTALVDLFLNSRTTQRTIVARGQCVERYGASEAYMPLFEALRRMCRGRGGRAAVNALTHHAPSWVAEMPGVIPVSKMDGIRQRTGGVTRDRMLRELADAIDVIAREAPVVLVLEDLHWSDVSTLDALATLARRRDPARLLIIGTYRPEDLSSRQHPLVTLVKELGIQRVSSAVRLKTLTEPAVETYLAARFPGAGALGDLSRAAHRRTDGHPLFLVTLVDDWIANGTIVRERGHWRMAVQGRLLDQQIPDDVRAMIEARLDRLTADERRLVEAASVTGVSFAAASVAAALGHEVADVDEQLAALARRHLLLWGDGSERWADGTISGRYRFIHALYHEVTYAQTSPARRQSWHGRVATREQAGYGRDASAIAARLAMHFEHAGDDAHAARYHASAAQHANALAAYEEAIVHATAGLASAGRIAGEPGPSPELGLQLALGAAFAATQGFAADAAERAYARAAELSRDVMDTPETGAALAGLYAYHLMRGPVSTTGEFATRLVEHARRTATPDLVIWSKMADGVHLLQSGQHTKARASFEDCLAQDEGRRGRRSPTFHAIDPRVASLGYLSWCLWLLGFPAEALERGRQAIAEAEETIRPMNRAHSWVLQGHLHQLRQEVALSLECAEHAIELSTEYGLGQFLWPARIVRGWARAMNGGSADGIRELGSGIAAWDALGSTYSQSRHWGLLAEALAAAGRLEEADAALVHALGCAARSGERCWEPELYRLRAERLFDKAERSSGLDAKRLLGEARQQLQRALDLARSQDARAHVLRVLKTGSRVSFSGTV